MKTNSNNWADISFITMAFSNVVQTIKNCFSNLDENTMILIAIGMLVLFIVFFIISQCIHLKERRLDLEEKKENNRHDEAMNS